MFVGVTTRCSTNSGIGAYTDIVIVQLSGISGSKLTESEGDSPRMRFVYVAINPWQLYYKCYISLGAVGQHT